MDCSLPSSSLHGIFPGKNTGVGCHFLLQGIFLSQGLSPHLLHWQVDSLPLSQLGSPQFSSVAQSCQTLCDQRTAAHQTSLSFTISQSLFKFMSIELVMPFNHLILCHPILLLHSIFPSIRVFSNELTLCIRWPKYWSFSFSIRPYNKYSGLIFFRIDWFDLLAVQGTLKNFSSTTIWKHQLFGNQTSLWSSSHISAPLLGKP